MGAPREPLLGRLLGRLSLHSAAHPRRTVVVIVALSFFVGLGMTQLETDADLLKILPKDDPATRAAQNASHEFRGFYEYVEFFYQIDPDKCETVGRALIPHVREGGFRTSERDCATIMDEVYIRGMDEIWTFIQAEIDSAAYAIDVANIVKLVNWTNSGYDISDPEAAILQYVLTGELDRIGSPRDEAFAMPGTDPKGAILYEAAYQGALAADDSVTDAVSDTRQAGRTLIFFDADAHGLTRVDLGREVYRMVDAYRAAVDACDDGDPETPCTLTWNVFAADGLAVRGVAAYDAHASDTTQRDISRLAPIILWAIVLVLYLAFRDVRVILVAAANLLLAFVWTAGLMGWLQIPFSALNMTIVPLILGVGIDYGIHMVSEFLEHKADGTSDTEAFRLAGRRAGVAMAIATMTTSVGLLVMVFSPSVLMGQLAIVSSIAMVVTFFFTITFVPALLTLTRRDLPGRKEKGSRWVLAFARGVSQYRIAVLVLVLVVSAMAAASIRDLQPEGFGNPQLNYPPGDRLRDDAQFIFDVFYGGDADAVNNFLILQGDMTRPEVHEFIRALERGLAEHPEVNGFSIASPVRIVEAWKAVEGGTPNAILSQFVLQNFPDENIQNLQYPQSQDEIRQTFDDIFASPMANFMTVLLNHDYTMATVTYDTSQTMAFDEVSRIWAATQEVIDQARAETGVTEEEVQVHPFGNNAFSFLFIERQQPWVNAIGFVSYFLVVGMIAALTRNVRATACTAVVMGLTGLWWLGTLPLIGVGLSVGLMLPLVFIMAIGTDDAVHLIWNMEQTRDRNKVYRFVGKAVLLTSITTLVAFGLFSRQTDLLVTQTLLATAVAVAVMWLVTMLVVPLFYPVRATPAPLQRPDRPASSRNAPAPAPTITVLTPDRER